MHNRYSQFPHPEAKIGSEDSIKNPFTLDKPSFELIHRGAANMFDVYINQPIGAPEDYTKLFSFLRSVTPMDEVFFFVNCPGGRLDTGLQFLNAIEDCQGKITMVLDGEAYSMAAFLVFSGDEIVVTDNGMLMVHNYSGGLAGKGGDILTNAEAYNKMMNRLMTKYFSGFLTEQEIKDVLHGKDMYFDVNDMEVRLNARDKYIEDLEDKALVEHENGVDAVLETMIATGKPIKKVAKKKAPVKKRPIGKKIST
jgi:ATP-dependent protease ClpP protease subunit